MEFAAIIGRIKQALISRRYNSEADVREAVVLPVLRGLGWDDLDPDRVMREYALGGRRVDYALSAYGRQPALFIEVKGPGPLIGVEKQLFEYAFHAGIQFAILTNGQEWSFFLPAAPGSYEERLLYKLNVVEREVDEVIERLIRYLGFDRVRSGEALKDANRDYDNLHKERIVRDALPRAWAQILSEPDELLVDLIAERATSLAGYPAARELVLEFLAGITGLPARTIQRQVASTASKPLAEYLKRPISTAAKHSQRIEPPQNSPMLPNSEVQPRSSVQAGGQHALTDGFLRYTFEGQEFKAYPAYEVLLHVVRTLANRQSTFLERFAKEARGRTRNHIAQRPEDVYPDQPHLIGRVMELVPGWYIGTNISSEQKESLLKTACKVAGLTYGVDLVVDLRSAKS